MSLNRLQGAKKVAIGTKTTIKAVKNREASVVYVAQDAERRVLSPVIDLCKENNIEVIEVPQMDELGKACGIKVGAAMAAIMED